MRVSSAEAITVGSWTHEDFRYDGKFWQVHVRGPRPRPLTRPHPALIHASSSERSIPARVRLGRPFLMNLQSTEAARYRVALYRAAMREAGHDEAAIARTKAATALGDEAAACSAARAAGPGSRSPAITPRSNTSRPSWVRASSRPPS
ncbi:MAG: LLM class flavin-dependent oxidoreductase [Acetobacteraceae bacterium]|nr:LLM class flavin-dependent oxidoreductase [Acetobacteraceae bacterium]